MLKVRNSCTNCAHDGVCMYKTDLDEVMHQVDGKLDNCGYYNDDIFEVSLSCKQFQNKKDYCPF